MFLCLMRWIQCVFSSFVIPATDELRIVLSFSSALFFTLVYGKSLIAILKRYKIGDRVERDYCETLEKLHKNKNDTPTMGGILIAAVLLLSLCLWGKWTSPITWILVFVVLSSSLLGFCDDFLKMKRKNSKGISAKKKLIVQLWIASCIAVFTLLTASLRSVDESSSNCELTKKDWKASSYLYIPFRKTPLACYGYVGLSVTFLLIVFVMVGASNAVNLTDGLDGLASGTSIIVAIFFLCVAWITGHAKLSDLVRFLHIPEAKEIAVFMAAFLGTCSGFLRYNRYPARIFMGDTGSLMLGNIMGSIAVFLRRELFLAIVGGVFVIEALSVIIQVYSCKLRGKRVFLCSPLHHHFEYLGWSERKVVSRFWIIGMLLGILGVISLF